MGTDMSHKHSSKSLKSLQNIKTSPAVLSCNINVDTAEMNDVSFLIFQVPVSGLAVRGSGPGQGDPALLAGADF